MTLMNNTTKGTRLSQERSVCQSGWFLLSKFQVSFVLRVHVIYTESTLLLPIIQTLLDVFFLCQYLFIYLFIYVLTLLSSHSFCHLCHRTQIHKTNKMYFLAYLLAYLLIKGEPWEEDHFLTE